MSPTFNRSSTLQCFERGNMVEIRNGMMFDFYPGLPHILIQTYIVCILHKVLLSQLFNYHTDRYLENKLGQSGDSSRSCIHNQCAVMCWWCLLVSLSGIVKLVWAFVVAKTISGVWDLEEEVANYLHLLLPCCCQVLEWYWYNVVGWLNPRLLFTEQLHLKCQHLGLAFNRTRRKPHKHLNFFLSPCACWLSLWLNVVMTVSKFS